MGGETRRTSSSIIGCTRLFSKLKPYVCMVSLQFGYAGMYVISLVSFKRGLSHFVLPVYRHAVATLVMAPFALLLERPVLDQNLYYLGMKYTSATFASATVNILPAITFVMAIIFRLERVDIRKAASQAKVVGTSITVSGAMIMTLYKGPIIDFITWHDGSHSKSTDASQDQHWVSGTIMLLAACCGWASFFILQSFTLKLYPAELSLSALICLIGMLEGAVVALIMERDMSGWAIGWDSTLLAPVYAGIVCSGIAYYVQGKVINERGPVFVTSFSPLCMIVTAALGAIILAEQVHLGSIIGAVFIVIGLYAVVWGKSKDRKALLAAGTTGPKANTHDLLPVTTSCNAGGDEDVKTTQIEHLNSSNRDTLP
uniref:WAT1-related protein n=1 Tax=Kalanchoe fedtschenkoi TaxID=63787 RepID=A0A7N0ZVW6_KALFE